MGFRKIILAEARRQGLSGYRLAKCGGMPLRTVQQYLAGDADMSGERVAKVAAVLGLELRPKRRAKKGR